MDRVIAGEAFSDVTVEVARSGENDYRWVHQIRSLVLTDTAYLQPTDPNPATMSPQDAQKAIATELPSYLTGGSGAAAARERIIAIMAAQMHISQADAAKRFDQLQARATQAKNQAIETAENAATKTADTASTGSYLIFGVLLLDLVAAAAGGSLAVQRRTLLRERIGSGEGVHG